MSDVRRLEPDEVVVVAAGLLAFFASFLPWFSYRGLTASAWKEGLFPTYTWVGLAGLALAALTVLPVLTTVRVPAAVVGFTLHQVKLVLAGLALLLAISFLIAGEQHGAGFWLSFLASIGLLVGVLMRKEAPPAESEA